MNSPEVSLSSSQEASPSSHQTHLQGSASGSQTVQAEAQVHASESGFDSDVQYMGAASAQETSQVDHDTGDQNPQRPVESPPVRETSNRRPRGRQRSQERRRRERSRAYRIEGRIYNEDRSRSPPGDRRRSGSARSSSQIRNQRRDSQVYSSGDDFSGMERSLHLILQKRLFQQIPDTVPYCDGNKMIGFPKGYKITVNQKSIVLTPMGTQWK